MNNVDEYQSLNQSKIALLTNLVFEREFDENHPDDYFNAGGFHAHWQNYTDEEREELLKIVRNE